MFKASLQNKKIYAYICVLLVCVSIFFASVQFARAQFGGLLGGLLGAAGNVVTVIGGDGSLAEIQNALTNSLNQALNQSLHDKEFIFDPLAHQLSQRALEQQTADLLSWFNSGFQNKDGSTGAAFITNLEKYREDVRTEAYGGAIYEDLKDSNICETFKHEVITTIALEIQEEEFTPLSEQPTCSLDEFSEDTEAYLSGDEGTFSEGGWQAWFQIAMDPETTPLGAKIANKARVIAEADEQEDNALRRADYANGSLDVISCADGTISQGTVRDNCVVTTPGSLINEQVAFQLQVPTWSLINSDEMNEVIGGLFGDLASQAITGINGLLGLGGNVDFSNNSFGASGNISFLDALKQGDGTDSTDSGAALTSALENANLYLEYQLEITSVIDEIESIYEDADASFSGESCWNVTFPERLTTERDAKLQEIPVTIATILALEVLVQEFEDTPNRNEQTPILQDFATLLAQGVIIDESKIIQIETLLQREIQPLINTLGVQIDQAAQSCN